MRMARIASSNATCCGVATTTAPVSGNSWQSVSGNTPYRYMRSDPRFVLLCARLGLVQYWLSSGQWPDCADEVPYDFKAECEKARHIPVEAFGF